MNVRQIAIEDDLATEATGIRAYIDEMIGCTHDLLVVLYDDNRIAQGLEFLQHMDESFGVSGVQRI